MAASESWVQEGETRTHRLRIVIKSEAPQTHSGSFHHCCFQSNTREDIENLTRAGRDCGGKKGSFFALTQSHNLSPTLWVIMVRPRISLEEVTTSVWIRGWWSNWVSDNLNTGCPVSDWYFFKKQHAWMIHQSHKDRNIKAIKVSHCLIYYEPTHIYTSILVYVNIKKQYFKMKWTNNQTPCDTGNV